MVLSGDGRYLFVTNRRPHSVSVFAVGEDGQLRLLGQSVATGGRGPDSMVLSGDGRYLFVANRRPHSVSVFAVGGDGQLRLIGKMEGVIGSLLFAPLPKRWQAVQEAEIAAGLRMAEDGISALPEVIKREDVKMLYGPDRVRSEEFKKEKIEILIKKDDVAIEELVTLLVKHHYDQERIAGGLLQRLASPCMQVERGTLTPEGFRLLEEWARGKSSDELQEAVGNVQGLLRKPEISPDKVKAFRAIKNRLVILHQARLAREQGE